MLKRFTPRSVRKSLAEALVISKLDYCNALFNSIPQYLIRRMQRVQTAAASYIHCKRAREEDVLSLKWLPVKERIQYAIAKLAYKAINHKTWPSYITIKTRQPNSIRSLRSNENAESLIELKTTNHNTFEHSAASVFNELPITCRMAESYHAFCNQAKAYLLDKAMARILAHS